MNIADFWSGAMSTRRMWTLLMQLPAESRMKYALNAAHGPAPDPEPEPAQQAVEARHAALEEQYQRNRDRGLVL